MVRYRRYRVSGVVYFFTVVLKDRDANYLTVYIRELKAAIRRVREIHPFKTVAMVVLPNHLHVMWKLPEGDVNYSLRWRCIKTEFGRNLKKSGVEVERNRFGENNLWQRRFWEHVIRDEKDYERHINYIHYNPVKHKLVKHVKDWPYSTFHRFVENKIYSVNWSSPQDDVGVE